MTILKIIGFIFVIFILQGVHRACIMATRDIKKGNFHGQDPKTIRFKFAQLLLFDALLWILFGLLATSLLKHFFV
jgi:hypothetical protein